MRRLIDLFSDNRLPWHFYKYLKSPQELIVDSSNILVSVTFDVEEDYPTKKRETARPFLFEIQKFLQKEDIEATFFVQGEMVEELASELRLLQKEGHEIGVHGFRHNNWGNAVWFWKSKPLSGNEKNDDLKKILETFRKNRLPKPISFRAPNMNSNEETIGLLKKFGFQLDSSWPSFRGSSASVERGNLPKQIPVTSLARPTLSLKKLPVFDFKPFNMSNIAFLTRSQSMDYVKSLLNANGGQSLVFLAHPWEFYHNESFNYCGQDNYHHLKNLLTTLKKAFKAKFVAIKDLTNG